MQHDDPQSAIGSLESFVPCIYTNNSQYIIYAMTIDIMNTGNLYR